MGKFFEELSRRKVIRVAIAYIVGGWLVIQVAETLFPNIGLPDTAVTLVIGLILVGFPLALILSWVFDVKPDEGPVEEKVTDTGPSIAVLPFPDMSAEKDQEHFCDGLTEELLNVLTCIPGLRVASRTSSFSLKGQQVDMAEIARRFNVRHILEGSVRKSGDRIRVTAQLIEAETDTHLWSETYDRELDDIFAIQDDIAARILEKLKLQLGTTRTAADETSNAKAYEYYLRGLGYRISKGTRDIEIAADMFRKAVELDPDFVSAWVNLAEMGAVYAVFYGDEQEWMAVCSQAGERLQELAPGEGVSYLTEGFSLTAQSDFDAAISQFKKALEIDSSLYIAWQYIARAQQHLGRNAEAADSYARATDCEPEDFESPSLASTLYRSIGDDTNARKYAKISIARSETNLRDYPENQRALYLGAGSMTVTGELDRGRRWVERAMSIDDTDMATRYNVACYYANVGDIDKALDCLEGSIIAKEWIEHDPDMDPLRDHPRYQAVMESLSG